MKKTLTAVALSILLMLTGGCWDRKEINDLGLIVAGAFDLENSEEEPVRLTLQIANPAAMTVGGGGGAGGATGGGAPKAFWITSETGRSIRAAALKMDHKIPNMLFFGHVRLYIFGEKAARSGVIPFIDRLKRSKEVRENSFIAVATGEGRPVWERETPVFRASGLALSDAFLLKDGNQGILAVTMSDFMFMLNSLTTGTIAPAVEIVSETSSTPEERGQPGGAGNTLRISGVGVFSPDGKLIDFFNERETLGLMWMLNKVRYRELTVPCPTRGFEEPISLGVYEGKSKIIVDVANIGKNGLPGIEVKVKTLVDVWEHFGSHPGVLSMQFVKDIEDSVSNQITLEIEAALKKAQLLKVDVFGFGEELRRQHHKDWHQIKNQWQDIFPEIELTVTCETVLRHRGLSIEPPKSTPEE